MSCLSRAELAKIALGLESSPGSSAHLQGCGRCQAELQSMRCLVRQLADGHEAFDQGHEQARARLLASLPASVGWAPPTATAPAPAGGRCPPYGFGTMSFPGSEH